MPPYHRDPIRHYAVEQTTGPTRWISPRTRHSAMSRHPGGAILAAVPRSVGAHMAHHTHTTQLPQAVAVRSTYAVTSTPPWQPALGSHVRRGLAGRTEKGKEEKKPREKKPCSRRRKKCRETPPASTRAIAAEDWSQRKIYPKGKKARQTQDSLARNMTDDEWG